MAEKLDTQGAVDAYLGEMATPAALGAQARLSMNAVIGNRPDYEAELRAVARRTGVPVDTVRSLPEEMKRQATLGAYDFDSMAAQFPLATKFLADQDKAAIAHDDVGVLSGLEGAAKWMVSAPGTDRNLANAGEYLRRSAHAGFLSLTGTGAKLLNAATGGLTEAELAVVYKDDPLAFQRTMNESAAAAPLRFIRSQQQRSEQVMAELSPETKAQYGGLRYGTLEENESAWRSPLKIVGDALQSIPSALATAVSVYLTKGAGGAAKADALAAGLTPQAAQAAAVLAAGETMARMGAVTEGAVGYAQQANQTREDADKVSDEVLATSPAYQKLLADGYHPKVARVLVSANAAEQAGVIAGIVDAAVNLVGGKFLGRIVGEGGRPGVAAAKAAATEGATEFVQSPGEQLGQNMAIQQNMNPGQDLTEGLLESALQGLAVGGLTGGAMGHLAARTAKADTFAQQAEHNATVLEAMQKTAEASKLLERSPETLTSYMQDLADQGAPVVYVDSAKLVEAGVDLNALAQAVPAVAAQLPQAETGGDFAIPTGELLTQTIGTEFAQPLIDHARTAPDGMSREEAKAYMQEHGDRLTAEVERVLATEADDAEFKAGRDQVQAQLVQQLNEIKRFTAKVNEQYATLAANFYAVMAARTGMTVQQFADTYKLGFAAGEAKGSTVLDQAPTLDQLRADFDAAGLDHAVAEKNGVITLSKIVVSQASRGRGAGTRAMQALVKYADATGQHIALSPSADFGGNKARLAEFYKRFGFIENKGKNRAFKTTESMYRPAPGKVLEQSAVAGMPLQGDEVVPTSATPAQVREKVTAWAKQRWSEASGGAPEAVRNADPAFGKEVVITWQGAKHALAGANEPELRLVPHIPDILRAARFTRTEPAKPGAAVTVKQTHFLSTEVVLAGESLTVGIVVHEKANGQMFYDQFIVKNPAHKNAPPLGASGSASSGEFSDALGYQPSGGGSSILPQDARGQIAFADDITRQASIISLFKGADLSTFIHESGHFYLQVQADLAARIAQRVAAGEQLTPGEQGIVDDFSKLLDWMGVKATPELSALDHWAAMTGAEKRPFHEKFARGFEAYAFEGKAPSQDLTRTFQTFRAWLVNVYRSLLRSVSATPTDVASAMDVELTPEVRSVMDRMLATSDQIAEAEAARDMGPLFKTAEEAGMTLDEFKAYHDQGVQATADAIDQLQSRGLKDMQWLQNARSRKLKELQKQHDALRAEITREVRAEVMAQPIYQAWAFLTSRSESKVVPGVTDTATADLSQASGKLRTQALRDAYGIEDDAIWRKLSALHMTSDEVGSHPDIAAEMFGFTSGDELVRKLVAAEPPASVIQGMINQRMLEEHGDLSSPAGIERAADEAIHNEARARFVATELRALQKAMSVREKVPGQKNTVDVLARAAREYASATIARLKVRDIRPGQYAAAEVRAAKAAAKAIGDVAKATMHKRNQLINMYAAKAAYAAQDEVGAIVKYLRKFDASATRQALPGEYLAQIDMLREKYELREQSGAEIDRTVALRTWVQSRLNAGEIPAISESLLAPAERRAYTAAIEARDEEGNLVYPDDEERIKLLADAIERGARRPYKEMTVEEIRGLRDTIKQIEHLGRLKEKMLTARDGATYAATRDLLAQTVVDNAKKSGKNVRTSNTLTGKALDKVKEFGASHIKVATWTRIFDGGKDNGPWWSAVIRPANERATFESTRRAKATSELMEIMGPVLKDVSVIDQIGKGQYFPELGTSLNWEERFAIAANYGNESNLQRLMGGGIEGATKTLSEAQIQSVLRTLTAAEWHAVQKVWDHFESYRPEIAAKELRVNGVEPEWIAPRPFSVRTADGQVVALRGGYFPVVYDPKTNMKAQQHSDAEAAKNAMKAAYSVATTQRSFTKARVEEVTGRALLLNLRGLYSGVNDVIHDLAWHEWVIDMNRLMKSNTIDTAIREHYGPNVKRELTKWRDDIVAGSKRLDHGIENAAGWMRKFVSAGALTYNVMSAMMQPLGITQSFTRVGTGWVAKGIGQYAAGPVEATRMVKEKSDFMANRTRTMFRDLNELRNRVAGQTTGRELMGRYGYFLTMHLQMGVDIPTWIGAYEKATAAGHDEATAIALADQSVKDSQGGGEEVDQAGITRGGPLVKLFTVFYDFMNTQANVLYGKAATSESKASTFMHFALVGVITPILAAALKDALTPGDSGDWDDWEKALKKMGVEAMSNLLGMVAFGREFTTAAKALVGEDKGVGYTGPAGLRMIPDTFKLAHQGELDDAFRKAFVNLMGDLAGIPAVQINRTVTGIEALRDGKTTNPAALAFGYQVAR
ncbi:GNAT family N-acetyltransferase [Variovorax terrae]|uniref:GNAT family N-acetyltransferase n=1 Tax=Variovorax terrae TaxID=2923278 RepID=A0A9X1VWB8_9BURK|nr:GNAT family N-acetyltransferase [Variovorax terrae]MCJ0764160.1 GNAT family N-acetyltransferase [Variovorax terrae]